MIRTFLIKLLLLIMGFSCFSQTHYYHSEKQKNGLNYYGSKPSNQLSNSQRNNKLSFQMSMGGSVSTFSGYGTVFRNFLAPSLGYVLSPKITLSGGAIINNYFFNSKKEQELPLIDQGNTTSTTLWVSSRYKINNKLSLSGTVYKEFTPQINKAFENQKWNDERHGVILDLEFRPNKNMKINTTFEYHKGRPDYFNPYYSPINPIYNSFRPY